MPAGGLGVGSLVSGVIGGISSSQQQAAATAAKQQALQQYLDINVPDPAQQQIILQQYAQTGQLNPQMEAAVNQQASQMGAVQLNSASTAAQNQALAKLSDITSNNGLDAQSINQNQQTINQENANTQGAVQAILQNANARGVGGSGASLAAQLAAQQNSANNANQNALGTQSLASQRALSSLAQLGSQSAALTNQNLSLDTSKAQAQDAINKFNTANSQSVSNQNVSNANNAQAYNVQTAQSIANQNTGIANQQEIANQALQQQNYQNELSLAAGRSNAENGVATQANANAQTTGNMWGGISGALGSAAGTVYKNQNKAADDDGGDEDEDGDEE